MTVMDSAVRSSVVPPAAGSSTNRISTASRYPLAVRSSTKRPGFAPVRSSTVLASRASAGGNGAAYFVVRNDGDTADRLIAVASPLAMAEMHESVMAEELIALTKARLGGYKAPKTLVFVDALPTSVVGKVLRREVKDKYWASTGRKVG